VRRWALAALVAGTTSGIPSTVHAVVTGRPVLGATRAAGTLLGRPSVARGLVAHTVLTLAWSAVLGAVLPTRHRAAWGVAGGLAIGLVDLAVADTRYPAIAALPRAAQLADHAAFGLAVATSARR
jgi:hypothetical protein